MSTDTSKEYDTMIGHQELPGGTLHEFLGEPVTPDTEQEAIKLLSAREIGRLHYKGMPQFEQNEKKYRILLVKFETDEDAEKFSEVTGIPLTPKTKDCWYPPRELGNLIDFSWVDETQVDDLHE